MKRDNFSGNATFPKGIHPPERKHFSADAPIEVVPTPKEVLIPLQQHIGAPAQPVVSEGDAVSAGDLIAQIPEGQLGATLHASITGRVSKVTPQAIEIAA